jgi:tetratricopeptide (TPR) repeat protein
MRILLLISAMLFYSVSYCAAAGNYSAQWQKANEYYNQKQYDSAATLLEQIAALKSQNAVVYYNLGNTYYRLNKVALAVLNYERALRMNPEYKDAKDNLVLAQARISNHIIGADDIFFLNWWQSLTRAGNATTWAVTAVIFFILFVALLFFRRYLGSRVPIPVQLPGIALFVCVCFLVLAFAAAERAEEHETGVVMLNDAPLMNNEQKGKPLILVPEGTTVTVKSEKGTWLEVILPDGRKGCLQQNVIERI